VANAVFDAVGVRLTALPITAEQVYAGLQAKAGRQ
jgi:CO/xanthine dehydrogenase Mo-binding subunit